MGARLSVSFCTDTTTDFQWVSLFHIYAPSLKRPFSVFLRWHCSWNFNRNATVTSCSNKQALASTVVAWAMNEPLLRSKVPVVSASSEDPQRRQSQHQIWWSSTRVWIRDRKWKEKAIFVWYKREHQRSVSLCIEGVTLPSHRHLAVANRLCYVYI